MFADDTGIASTSADGLARVMTGIVVVCPEFELTIWEHKTESMYLWSVPSYPETTLAWRQKIK